MSSGIPNGNVFTTTIIEITITPASVAAASAPVQTFTVPGVQAGDAVMVCPPGQTNNVTIGSVRVSADNTISVQFVNPTAGALVPAAGVHVVMVMRKEGLTAAPRVLLS